MTSFYSQWVWYCGLFIMGGIGVVLRVFTIHVVTTLLTHTTAQLWAVGLCNVFGAFLAGFLWGAPRSMISPFYQTIITMGLLGGYTTFSAAMIDTLMLMRTHAWNSIVIYLSLTLVLGICGAILGFFIVRFFTSS